MSSNFDSSSESNPLIFEVNRLLNQPADYVPPTLSYQRYPLDYTTETIEGIEKTRLQNIDSAIVLLFSEIEPIRTISIEQSKELVALYKDVISSIYQVSLDQKIIASMSNIYHNSQQYYLLKRAFSNEIFFKEYLSNLDAADSMGFYNRVGRVNTSIQFALEEFAYHDEALPTTNINNIGNPSMKVYPFEPETIEGLNEFRMQIDHNRKEAALILFTKGIRAPLTQQVIETFQSRFSDSLVGVAAIGLFWRYIIEKHGYGVQMDIVLEELQKTKIEFLEGKSVEFGNKTVVLQTFLDEHTPSSNQKLTLYAKKFAENRIFRQRIDIHVSQLIENVQRLNAMNQTFNLTGSNLLRGGFLEEILSTLYVEYGNDPDFLATFIQTSDFTPQQDILLSLIENQSLLKNSNWQVKKIALEALRTSIFQGSLFGRREIQQRIITVLIGAGVLRGTYQDIIKNFLANRSQDNIIKYTRDRKALL